MTKCTPHSEDSRGKTHMARAQRHYRDGPRPHQNAVSSRRLPSFHPNRDDRQRTIAAIGSPFNVHDDLVGIRSPNRNRLGKFDAFPYLLRCSPIQRRMWTMLGVPGSVTIKSTLQRRNTERQDGYAQPDAQRSEQAFHLAVERRLANLAFDHGDATTA